MKICRPRPQLVFTFDNRFSSTGCAGQHSVRYIIFCLQASYLSATSHTGRESCRAKSLYMKRFWSSPLFFQTKPDRNSALLHSSPVSTPVSEIEESPASTTSKTCQNCVTRGNTLQRFPKPLKLQPVTPTREVSRALSPAPPYSVPMLRIRIQDPVPFLPLDPGSGMHKKVRIRIRDPG
jgi:hypothetical protein